MCIITKKFRNFWVCFDWPFLLNIPVQVMLDFGKSWSIEYKQCIEFNDYSLKMLELVMISAKDLHDYFPETTFII